MKDLIRYLSILGFSVLLAGCAPSSLLPSGLTPIPTLKPATAASELSQPTSTPSPADLSFPAGLPSAESGKGLYQENCMDCHDENGEGLVADARSFNDVGYMRGEEPVSFYVAVTEGVGDMPSFRSQMSSDERWDVVFYIWQFPTDQDNLERGESIYDANCESCHGPNGTNEDLGAVDFTDMRIVSQIAPRDHFQVITQGKGSMPAWQGRLSQDERWDVIDYLYTFAYQQSLSAIQDRPQEPTATVQELGCFDGESDLSNPFSWQDEEIIQLGQDIYDQSCAGCHAEDGTGNLAETSDFSTDDFQNRLLSESGKSYCIIAEGEGAMPGWKDSLSEREIWQVLTYIGSLGN